MQTRLTELIKPCPKVTPSYFHPGEIGGFNPTYENIEACSRLATHQKRIWVLRGDLILALGIKNLHADKGNTSLYEKIGPDMHQYLNPTDRYGHPSLAVPERGYDGSVYYAGWLIQFHDHIELILHSGRFQNTFLTIDQRNNIERFISLKLGAVYNSL